MKDSIGQKEMIVFFLCSVEGESARVSSTGSSPSPQRSKRVGWADDVSDNQEDSSHDTFKVKPCPHSCQSERFRQSRMPLDLFTATREQVHETKLNPFLALRKKNNLL